MSEKRPSREETATAMHAGVVADDKQEDELLERLPDGLAPLVSVQDSVAAELLEIAERQVSEVRKRLGPQSSKPRLKRVQELFNSKAGRAPKVSEEVNHYLRTIGMASQVAKYDGAFDHTMAAAYNNFDRASVAAGASFQSTYDDWMLAVRLYRADLRAAGAILNDQIRSAHQPAERNDFDVQPHGLPQVMYYNAADKVGDALLNYEKSMELAAGALAKSYGELVSGLYDAVTSLSVAEATFIASAQGAYKTFWTNVQSAMSQVRI